MGYKRFQLTIIESTTTVRAEEAPTDRISREIVDILIHYIRKGVQNIWLEQRVKSGALWSKPHIPSKVHLPSSLSY